MPLRALARSISILAVACVEACTTAPAQADTSAVLDSDRASHAALEMAVRDFLGSVSIVLADDALTKDSRLTIEPTPLRDANGQRLQGRETRKPVDFQLVRDARGACVLIREIDAARKVLSGARCLAK